MGASVNRTELMRRVRSAYYHEKGYAQPLDADKIVDFAVRAAFQEIMKALRNGESVSIRDFGRFELRHRAARRSYDLNRSNVARSRGMKQLPEADAFRPAKLRVLTPSGRADSIRHHTSDPRADSGSSALGKLDKPCQRSSDDQGKLM